LKQLLEAAVWLLRGCCLAVGVLKALRILADQLRQWAR
jgi:hypothetical protein